MKVTQISDFIKAHPLSIGVASLSLSALILYQFNIINPLKNNNQSKKQQKKSINNNNNNTIKQQTIDYTKQQQQINKQLLKLKNTRKKFLQLSKQIKIQYQKDCRNSAILTQQTLLTLLYACIQLVDPEQLNIIYNRSRQARRSIFNKILPNAQIRSNTRRDSLQSYKSTLKDQIKRSNKLQSSKSLTYPQIISFSEIYYRFIYTYEEEFKYLVEKTQKDFIVFLDINFQTLNQSINYHISKEDNQIFKNDIEEWTSGLRQALKPNLVKSENTLPSQIIKQVLKYQIYYLQQKHDQILQMIHKLGISNEQQLQCLPTFLSCLLEDTVWQKYQYQQQQMTLDMLTFSQNKQLEYLVQQFQSITEKIVQEMKQQVNKQNILQKSYYF